MQMQRVQRTSGFQEEKGKRKSFVKRFSKAHCFSRSPRALGHVSRAYPSSSLWCCRGWYAATRTFQGHGKRKKRGLFSKEAAGGPHTELYMMQM